MGGSVGGDERRCWKGNGTWHLSGAGAVALAPIAAAVASTETPLICHRPPFSSDQKVSVSFSDCWKFQFVF